MTVSRWEGTKKTGEEKAPQGYRRSARTAVHTLCEVGNGVS